MQKRCSKEWAEEDLVKTIWNDMVLCGLIQKGSWMFCPWTISRVDIKLHTTVPSTPRPSKNGLFFSDVKNDVAQIFVNTVDNNKSKYTIKEYSDAVCACYLQNIIGRPSTLDFIKYTERNMISNNQWQKLT